MLLLSLLLLTPVVQAESIPIVGRVAEQNGWTYSASSAEPPGSIEPPYFSFNGAEESGGSIHAECIVGVPCNLSATVYAGPACGQYVNCTVTLGENTYGFIEGSMYLKVKAFVPPQLQLNGGVEYLTLPMSVTGQFEAIDCDSWALGRGPCLSVPPSFTFDVNGLGSMTIDMFSMGGDYVGINIAGVGGSAIAWTGVASVTTPEPNTGLLLGVGFLCTFVALRRRMTGSRSLSLQSRS